jgi:glycosyltransferase involved in cell wall biosynthesis
MSSRRRISFFVHDLADNPVGRAIPIAMALRDQFDIEILGLLCSGASIHQPYQNLFEYKVLPCKLDVFSVVAAIRKLASMASGSIIYACKPLLTSLGPALIAACRERRLLLLDVEDDEWIPLGKSSFGFIWRDLVKGWRHATAWKYTIAMHHLTKFAHSVTVSSTKLQRRYGGVLVRHGPDEDVFDPERPDLRDKLSCRKSFGLPPQSPLVLFAGLPRPHKGLPTLVDALLNELCANWQLVLVGPPESQDFELAAKRLGNRCHRLGFVDYSRLPSLLAGVDAVPLPQLRVRFAESQIPAKLMDAMAMGKSVVASRVGDLPEILGDGSRGWLCEPDDATELADALGQIAAHPEEALRRGTAARNWFLHNASASSIRHRILPLLTQGHGYEVKRGA